MQIIEKELAKSSEIIEKHLNSYSLPDNDVVIFMGYNERIDNKIEIICHGHVDNIASTMISSLIGFCDTYGLDTMSHVNHALKQKRKEAH